jgi:polar amino acid transport system substrate-binding protein
MKCAWASGIAAFLLAGQVQAADLPSRIQDSHTLVAAIVPNYPPLDFRDPDSGKLAGLDVDLGEAIAKKLGLSVKWQETSFDQMVSSVATGRVDVIISGMTDLATRHDTASFVDYMRSGPQFFVLAARAGEFADMTALCGKSVGASRRTSFPKEIAAWSAEHCEAAGKPAIKFVGTEGSPDARLQLRQQRIDAAMQGSETLPYIMGQEQNTYAVIGKPIAYQLTGIGIAKNETGLQQAVAGALDALMADGTYKSLLDKWHLSDEAIPKATVNAGE